MKRLLLVLVGVIAAAILALWIIGLLLPADHVTRVSRWYPAPRDTVWTAISDVRAYPQWRTDLDSVTVMADPLAWREYGAFGAITFAADESVPRERLVTRIVDQDLGFGGRWIYTMGDSAGGTVLTIVEEGEVSNAFFRTISRFVTGHDATVRQYLDDLGGRVGGEGGGGGGGGGGV
ncbi:MAG TPA: SRPBCC family protein, partial [Gemmatimonadaceae bacterium]|nr:SRPBCC family protein [Gemmatimonadaceae bacterium]